MVVAGWKKIPICLVVAAFVVVGGSLVAVADDPERKRVVADNDAADLTSEHQQTNDNNSSDGSEEKGSFPVQLTKWLANVEGGFFNPKQEIRAVGDSSDDGGRVFHGIFAKEFIAKGDLLSQIPWEYIITDEETDKNLSRNDFEEAVLKCGTARNLAREMKQVQTLGKYIKDPNSASKYGPYIQYLMNQPLGVIPSEWSAKGRVMLEDVLGGKRQTVPPNYASTWLEEDWYEDCSGDTKDAVAAKAAMLVVSRGDDDLLVPVYDMYNHRNGKWYNTHMKVDREVNYQVTARKDIQPGEQIYNSYNMCDNCGGRKDGYGTPEIFRDYGFVENFPQRWNFEEFEFMFDLSESEEDGSIEIIWAKRDKPTKEEDISSTKRLILKELKRLRKMRHLLWQSDWKDGKSSIPENEWNNLWKYHQTLINALSYAYNDIVEDESQKVPVGNDETCTSTFCGADYFDTLEWEEDELKYNQQTCENKEIMRFPDYHMLEGLKTHYQELNFAFRLGTENVPEDICMDLEDTVQICSSYRPHYHEFSSHFAARFVDDIKRVVFVGGGDSMMLHEVLKYPSLEKVVGLELDQTVVRKSFKYFRTQAHFDDDRVEWWFGDATKSLLLLPEDYWGSFDLVIIDLSETVMAFSVTEKLDVFAALALLLNQDGVMVKNEHYMETMSEAFDYTLQVYLDQNPKICSQCMIFGSNKADFFRRPLVDHNVETLLLPNVESLETGYEYFHDFRKNDALEQGKCDEDTEKKEDGNTTQTKSAGLLHILDAEDVAITLDKESIEKIILSAAKEEGFTPISADDDKKYATVQYIADRSDDIKSSLFTVVFKEGYVSVRYWPKSKYCAVDVGVWGSYQKGDELRKRIGEELKAKTASYFRVVVGGMYGSSTWQEDKDLIGPQIVQNRNCEESNVKDVEFTDKLAKKVVLDEAINLVGSRETIAAVICGVENVDKCPSLDVLEQHATISKVIPIWTCPELSKMDDDDPDKFMKMNNCEEKILSDLMEVVSTGDGGIGMVVIDGSTSNIMGQIFHSILTVISYREMLFSSESHFILALSNKPLSDTWQRNLLERYRKELYWDPAKRVEININVGGAAMELGIVSNNDFTDFANFKELEQKLSERLPTRKGVASSAEVISITGALFPFMHDYNPHEYVQSDYPVAPGDKQWSEQQSLGRKIVVQYELNKDKGHNRMPDLVGLVRLIDSTVTGYGLYEFEVYTDIGDGVLIVTDFKLGTLIVLWDGREHVDLNIFLYDDSEYDAKDFMSGFTRLAGKKLKMTLRDDFPRGIGRVMNFREDMSYKGFESIWDLEPYVDQGDDDDDDEDDK